MKKLKTYTTLCFDSNLAVQLNLGGPNFHMRSIKDDDFIIEIVH